MAKERTRAELEKAQHRISREREALRSEGVLVAQELDALAVRERVALMTDTEREALKQELALPGIESAEAAGTPGN